MLLMYSNSFYCKVEWRGVYRTKPKSVWKSQPWQPTRLFFSFSNIKVAIQQRKITCGNRKCFKRRSHCSPLSIKSIPSCHIFSSNWLRHQDKFHCETLLTRGAYCRPTVWTKTWTNSIEKKKKVPGISGIHFQFKTGLPLQKSCLNSRLFLLPTCWGQ